jgi:hypothetical protein
MEAVTVAFETNERVSHPKAMADAIRGMTNGSIYFHYLEGFRRPPLHKDDFSAWLSEFGSDGEQYASAISKIDFYFKTLPALREELFTALRSMTEVNS